MLIGHAIGFKMSLNDYRRDGTLSLAPETEVMYIPCLTRLIPRINISYIMCT